MLSGLLLEEADAPADAFADLQSDVLGRYTPHVPEPVDPPAA